MVQCVGRERKVVLLVRAIILMSASWWQVPGLKLVTRAEGRKSLLAAIKFVPVRLSTEKNFPSLFSSSCGEERSRFLLLLLLLSPRGRDEI